MTTLPNLRPLEATAFIRSGGRPPQRVFRSAALSHYGLKGIEIIRKRLGVQTHLDLRSEHERGRESSLVREAEARFRRVLSVPITTTMPSPSSANPRARDYVEYYKSLLGSADSFARAFVAVGEHVDHGVLFSCSQGKDRTGLLAATLLEAAGCSRQAILTDYAKSLRAVAESAIVEPRSWESQGLDRDTYLRRYDLGEAPMRLLLQCFDREGTSLLQRVRSQARDRAAFDTVVKRIAAASKEKSV